MLTLQTAVAFLTDHPEAAILLAVALRLARAHQHELMWPEYRQAMRAKRLLFPLLADTSFGDRLPLVTELDGRFDREFRGTVDLRLRAVIRRYRDAGGQLHLINSLKRRRGQQGDPLSAAHVVWTGRDEQVEASLFQNDNGSVDVFVHTETAIDDPVGHLTDGTTPGDEFEVVPGITESRAEHAQ